MFISSVTNSVWKANIKHNVRDSVKTSKLSKTRKLLIRKNIFACLFSIHNTISLSRHEQVCLSGLLLPSSGNVNDYVAYI